MSLLTLILVLVFVGVVLYVIDRFVPMSPPIKRLLIVLVVLFLLIWIAQALGVFGALDRVRVD